MIQHISNFMLMPCFSIFYPSILLFYSFFSIDEWPKHLWTPLYHRNFFRERNEPSYDIFCALLWIIQHSEDSASSRIAGIYLSLFCVIILNMVASSMISDSLTKLLEIICADCIVFKISFSYHMHQILGNNTLIYGLPAKCCSDYTGDWRTLL